MDGLALVNWEPVAHVALAGVALATGPLGWIWARHRGADTARRVHALTLLTLFLTFDLVLFGAFTRLTDSGLGCPDWPGCYASASPSGAQAHISQAEAADRDAGMGVLAGRLRRADGDDEALPRHRHDAPARRPGAAHLAVPPG